MKIGILFAIGGDGTLRGAQTIAEEARRRGLEISVIGIPKTIDNDISFVQKTFGFETAVTEARRATYCGHTPRRRRAQRHRPGEAHGPRLRVHRGLFGPGRQPGELLPRSRSAVHARAHSCLRLKQRLERRGHAVIVVAEGAGQDLWRRRGERDASGNVKYGDIGIFLRDGIKEHFKRIGMEISLKYIDPSYTIRSVPANPHDSAFCLLLGHSAVHAGMSGRTNMVVGFWNHQFTHVPISLAVSAAQEDRPRGTGSGAASWPRPGRRRRSSEQDMSEIRKKRKGNAMKLPPHKTKIVCTIGPASDKPEVMEKMLRAGMNIARLNFSHGSFDSHREVVRNLRAVAYAAGRRVAIMGDLSGPKMRIGMLAEEPLELKPGDPFVLTTEDIVGDAGRASVTFAKLPQAVRAGDTLFLNDGIIQLTVLSVRGSEVACRVMVGGELRSRKGLNLPGIDLGISAFTERDHECLKFAVENGIDAVSQSFVETAPTSGRSGRLRTHLGITPSSSPRSSARGALDHIDDILDAADGIMIARGDLGVEVPIERIAVIQKDLMRRANRWRRRSSPPPRCWSP